MGEISRKLDSSCFNRRGDSLGGATGRSNMIGQSLIVSIAGAILWGEQHRGRKGGNVLMLVSIAGAILWGEQPPPRPRPRSGKSSFNRRGDSLGGATT